MNCQIILLQYGPVYELCEAEHSATVKQMTGESEITFEEPDASEEKGEYGRGQP